MTPANPNLAVGATRQFTATGTFSDDSTENLTSQVTWASASHSVATISASGLASALTEGNTSITASLNGINATTMLTVTRAASLCRSP